MSEDANVRSECCLTTHPAVLDGFADRIRNKLRTAIIDAMTATDLLTEEQEKGRVYYAFNHQMQADGETYYQAYMVDNENGEIFPIFNSNFSTQNELKEEWQRRVDGGLFDTVELIECTPQQLLVRSNDIVAKNKNKEMEMAQDKYKNFTPQGYKVLSIVKDRDDRNIAILQYFTKNFKKVLTRGCKRAIICLIG